MTTSEEVAQSVTVERLCIILCDHGTRSVYSEAQFSGFSNYGIISKGTKVKLPMRISSMMKMSSVMRLSSTMSIQTLILDPQGGKILPHQEKGIEMSCVR